MRRALLPLVLLLAACASVAPPAVDALVLDRVYCGRTIPDGGIVDDASWETFVREVVTPRFPDGFTIYRAEGAWGEQGETIREPVTVIEVVHPYSAELDRRIVEIAESYRTRFRQTAVLRISVPARIDLVDGD
jgi:hypothetical protein